MSILATIIQSKLDELASRKTGIPLSALREMDGFTRDTKSLRATLLEQGFGIIAEIKRSSPSAGLISHNFAPASIASEYELFGAAAISVLTDERFFGGCLDDLREVRKATSLPLLRKDFIIDEYQIHEAKAYGADVILLIASALEPSRSLDLFLKARELGLECLVEVHSSDEIQQLDPRLLQLVGINNRDLSTFTTDIETTFRLATSLPPDSVIVSESGITSPIQTSRLRNAGIRGALVGEHLMKSQNRGAALSALIRGGRS